jgi:hypothetical protein
MAKAVEEAAVVCCFMTKKYQESRPCEKELTYADEIKKRIIPCVLVDKEVWKPDGWLALITAGHQHINFCNTSEANIRNKVNVLIDRIKYEFSASATQSLSSRSKLIEPIRHQLMRNNRIL